MFEILNEMNMNSTQIHNKRKVNDHDNIGKFKKFKLGTGRKSHIYDDIKEIWTTKEGETDHSEDELTKIRENLKGEVNQLPIYSQRKLIKSKLLEHDKLVLVGETGSGKTTQVPKFIYQANINRRKCIAVTQPRRVAAITLARRVAMEMGTRLGDKVGYNVRFDNSTSDETKIIFMTDGMLLREALLDPKLMKYGVVILDEAHERTVETDVLFGIVKSAQLTRSNDEGGDDVELSPLKIIVMSATMNVDQFSTYFNGAGIFHVAGRQHRIEILYVITKLKIDYLEACLDTVVKIHTTEPTNQDILVFLTGQDEIETAVKMLKKKIMTLSSGFPTLIMLPFYSALPPSLQVKVFDETPKGMRKVVFSTNLAETSLTIRGIKFVVDSGRTKVRTFNPLIGIDQLKVEMTSQAQANQRAGRAGRESDGVCYRLYTKEVYDSLKPVAVPEIQRRSLSSVILQLLFMGIRNVATFDFMDKPTTEAISNGLRTLKWLGAVVEDGDDDDEEEEEDGGGIVSPLVMGGQQHQQQQQQHQHHQHRQQQKQQKHRQQHQQRQLFKLTKDGRQMATFPLDPQFSRILLNAHRYGCLPEILTIISMLSADSVFVNMSDKRQEIRDVRSRYEDASGDLLTLLNVYREYKKANDKQEWCHKNYVNERSMKVAMEIRGQLKQLCINEGLKIGSNRGQERSDIIIRKCLCTGLFMNIARYVVDRYITLNENKEVSIHPSSCLHKSSMKPDCLLFCELVDTNDVYMRNVCVVEFDWLKELAPPTFQIKPIRRPDRSEVTKRRRSQVLKMDLLKQKLFKKIAVDNLKK